MNYGLAYAVGFHPWEDALGEPAFVDRFSELIAREENGHAPPYGRALDLGTGSGIWATELAKRGWDVTGIDIVDRALQRGHARVREAGVRVRFVQGNVTDLRAAGIGRGFRLLLDTGTYHGLKEDERRAMAGEVSAVAADEATLFLLVWAPRRRGPLPRGASRDEIEAHFPGWRMTTVVPSYFRAPPPVELFMKPDEHWYRLERG